MIATQNIAQAISRLYEEADIPPPSSAFPVTPLGPLLDRLAVSCVELPNLTAGSAEAFLLRRGVLRDSLMLTGDRDEPLSGFLYAVGNMAFLFVNQNDPVTRRRFSVGHELGHLILHFRPALEEWRENAQGNPESFRPGLCDAFSKTANDSDETDTLQIREAEANRFAALILVPDKLLQTRWQQQTGSNTARRDRLATEFLVSRAVMELCAKRLAHPSEEQETIA